jgi:hypothetical protein
LSRKGCIWGYWRPFKDRAQSGIVWRMVVFHLRSESLITYSGKHASEGILALALEKADRQPAPALDLNLRVLALHLMNAEVIGITWQLKLLKVIINDIV